MNRKILPMAFEVFLLPAVLAYIWFFIALHRSLGVALALPLIVIALDFSFAVLDAMNTRSAKRLFMQVLLIGGVFSPILIVSVFWR